MTMAEWDFKVAPYLRHIESSLEWVEYYATKAVNSAKAVDNMPPWETKAEEGIDRAIKKLQEIQEILSGKRNNSSSSDKSG